MPSWQMMYIMRAVSVVTQTSCLYCEYSIPEADLPVNHEKIYYRLSCRQTAVGSDMAPSVKPWIRTAKYR